MIETERLILREWRESDLAPFAAMNADPQVRRFFPSTLTREQSDASVDRFRQSQNQDGFCFFAAELRATQKFIGFIGLQRMSFHLRRIAPRSVEIGWRLMPEVWGQGLATEGACAALRFAFDKLCLEEVLAFTVPANLPSRRVMEKLGMTHDLQDDFDHPNVVVGHPMRRHVLYRTSGESRKMRFRLENEIDHVKRA